MNGLRNNYRSTMPLTERMLKDLRSALGDSIRFIRNGGKLPAIVVWPDYPSKKTTIHKIAAQLRYRLTNALPPNPAVVLYFEDQTTGDASSLRQHYPDAHILNERCTDISKERTDAAHHDVFGYSTIIDPLTYSGDAVEKSSENALHDGHIVRCPLTRREPGKIYQLVIDNQHDATTVVDFRVPVIGDAIPHVYKKFKRNEVRFTNQVSYSELHTTVSCLSAEEQHALVRFARAMGADFCELDVLRHRGDGRIYVVDLNKTPYGPPAGLSAGDRGQAIQRLTAAFRELFNS
jgi:hypothetical protein